MSYDVEVTRAAPWCWAVALLLGGCLDWQGLSSSLPDSRVSPDVSPKRDAAWCRASTVPSSCAPGLYFCEGFESALSTEVWTVKAKLGKVLRDPSCTYRGQGALGLETEYGVTLDRVAASIVRHDPALAAMATVAIRAHYFLDEGPVNNATKILQLRQHGLTTTEGVRLQIESGVLVLESSLTNQTVRSTTAMPMGRWVCLELEVGIGSPAPIRAYLDGNLFLEASQVTRVDPPLESVVVGVINLDPVAPQPPIRMWIDEVAIDEQRVGCHP